MRTTDRSDDPEHIKSNALAYRQILLHRASLLFSGAIQAALSENAYSTAFNIRAHFETTAAIGFVHKKLRSAKEGFITTEALGIAIANLILGSKQVTKIEVPPPKQIMMLLDDADATVNAVILKGSVKHNILRESYEYLCEFAHPNFHSNALSFDLNRNAKQMVFRHGMKMRDHEDKLLSYLLFSGPIFLQLYDEIPERLASIWDAA